jgi:hypothetical protein
VNGSVHDHRLWLGGWLRDIAYWDKLHPTHGLPIISSLDRKIMLPS